MTTRSSFAIDVPAALLARAQQGERAAFEQLYRWFERPVFTLALRICGDRLDADEVLQETMLKVWSATSGAGAGGFRGDGGSPFWGWLRQVAVNESLMLLRRGRRLSVELDGHDADEHAEDHAPPPTPPCCNVRWTSCRTRHAACCGCTTARATPTTRSQPRCSAA